jgi:[glutamine synthetase] adenylyltransferase / [glutamine synthetase]-adenylyl-L-tyrosine phosphorylase
MRPSLLVPGTFDALQRLSDGGFLDAVMATALMNNYRTLRDVESKLCLLASPRRHEIPEDPAFLELLACLMNEANGSEIMSQCREYRISNRRMFNQLMEELSR